MSAGAAVELIVVYGLVWAYFAREFYRQSGSRLVGLAWPIAVPVLCILYLARGE